LFVSWLVCIEIRSMRAIKNVLAVLAFVLAFQFTQAQDLEPKGRIKDPKKVSEKAHNLFMSQRLELATKQRDSLYAMVVAFHKDTLQRGEEFRNLMALHLQLGKDKSELSAQYRKLIDDYQDMNDRYTDLIKSSMSKTEQLNIALKEKGDLLQIREKKLAELEAIIKRQDSLTNALSDIVKKALLSFNSDELTVEMKNGKVYVSLSDKLLFKSGSADVEEKGLDAIKKLAEVLNKNMEIDVLVEGHTDNKPIKTAVFADNWDLSTARANNIVRLLSSNYAVEPKRLTAAGRGEYQPKANNEIAEGRAKNRRTEIILSPKLDELYKIINKKR
jgi:chemotaxis protein MotB